MWRTIGEISLLIAIGFISGLFTYDCFHKCPELQPQSFSSYEIQVSIPKTKEETKRLMLHNKAQFSILQQLEEWEKEKEKQAIRKGK